jgi:hypothetical protein
MLADDCDNNTGWLSDKDEHNWFNTAFGGFCSSEASAMAELDVMYDNYMNGTIPKVLAFLPVVSAVLTGIGSLRYIFLTLTVAFGIHVSNA